MKNRTIIGFLCLIVVFAAAWMSRSGTGEKSAWQEVAPGVMRTPGFPGGHALVDGDAALLIDAPDAATDLKGVRKIEGVLLTHYHRDVCRAVGSFLKKGIKVRAAKGTEE